MLDVFQYCRFLRHAGKIMVLFVLALTALSYYAVSTELADAVGRSPYIITRLALLALQLIFNLCIFMLLWSYFSTVTIDPGQVPPGWHPFGEVFDVVARCWLLHDACCCALLSQLFPPPYPCPPHNHAPCFTTQQSAPPPITGPEFVARTQLYPEQLDKRDVWRPRYCKKCRAWKPPRAHHCSVSGHCVLKMDHYCIWMVNTIGLLNYKSFLLFLIYTFVSTGIATCVLAHGFVEFLRAPPQHSGLGRPVALFLAFVVDVAFVLSVAGFLAIHARLLTRNMTTIEHFEKDLPASGWPFDRGWRGNVTHVFGRGWGRWWVPGYTQREVEGLLGGVLSGRGGGEVV